MHRTLHVQQYTEHLGYEVDTEISPIVMYKKGDKYVTLTVNNRLIANPTLDEYLLNLGKTIDDFETFIRSL